jgi:hypothetical protein
MATITKMRDGKLEVPSEILRHLHLDGDASFVVEIDPAQGSITLKKIDPAQVWFWKPEWQAGEREADADKKEGRFERYKSDSDFLDSFE